MDHARSTTKRVAAESRYGFISSASHSNESARAFRVASDGGEVVKGRPGQRAARAFWLVAGTVALLWAAYRLAVHDWVGDGEPILNPELSFTLISIVVGWLVIALPVGGIAAWIVYATTQSEDG